MRCEMEMCSRWDGHGCPCALLDLEPDIVVDEGFIRDFGPVSPELLRAFRAITRSAEYQAFASRYVPGPGRTST